MSESSHALSKQWIEETFAEIDGLLKQPARHSADQLLQLKKDLLRRLLAVCERLEQGVEQSVLALLLNRPRDPLSTTSAFVKALNQVTEPSIVVPLSTSSGDAQRITLGGVAIVFAQQRSRWFQPLLTRSSQRHVELIGRFYKALFDNLLTVWRQEKRREDGDPLLADRVNGQLIEVVRQLPAESSLHRWMAPYQKMADLTKASLLVQLERCVAFVDSGDCSYDDLQRLKPLFDSGTASKPSAIVRYLSIPKRSCFFTARDYETASLSEFSTIVAQFHTAAARAQYRWLAPVADKAVVVHQTSLVVSPNYRNEVSAHTTFSQAGSEQFWDVA